MDPMQNACWIDSLLFELKLASLEVMYSFVFALNNEASQANFNLNKRILIQQPLLNWVYVLGFIW